MTNRTYTQDRHHVITSAGAITDSYAWVAAAFPEKVRLMYAMAEINIKGWRIV